LRPKPVYKIETYTVGVLDHTITDERPNVSFQEVVTNAVGHFAFAVPAKKGGSYKYYDIAEDDIVKIWIGYDSVSGDPDFVGRVTEISGSWSKQTGYVRVISGLSQGEILQRQLKNKVWAGVGASTIVIELALNLGLAVGEIEADATSVTLRVGNDTYFRTLQKVSDYWFNAGTQIKKDFYVSPATGKPLVWKSRPFRLCGDATGTADNGTVITTVDAERTEVQDYWNGANITFTSGNNKDLTRLVVDFDAATDTLTHNAFPNVVVAGDEYTLKGVETLTVGDNILDYNVQRSVEPVANKIHVYGAPSINQPSDFDDYTELDAAETPADHGWSIITGVSLAWAVSCIEGARSVEVLDETGASTTVEMLHTLPAAIDCLKHGFSRLHFGWWATGGGNLTQLRTRVYAPDAGNSFYVDLNNSDGFDESYWREENFELGTERGWNVTGTPDWGNVAGVSFKTTQSAAGNLYLAVDKYYWAGKKYSHTKDGGAAVVREMEHEDPLLFSDAECQKRAETLYYQRSGSPIQIDVLVKGNPNILVGDRIPMTIPAENISAANYDVVSVKQMLSSQGYRTSATMLNTANLREPVARTTLDMVKKARRQMRDLHFEKTLR